MSDNVRLGRVAGFPVAVNWSVLVVVLLLAWGLADGILPQSAPGHGAATYWVAGVLGAVLLLCSLMAHELAHAVVARREGVEVEGLTLWMFGGVASLRGEVPSPGADFRIAAVGPGVSLVLAGGFGIVWRALDLLGAGALALGVSGWLATVNLVLAVFNLIPGAPLDGGRVLRAFLWWRRGDRTWAATTAASAGQGVAYVLVVIGVVALVAGDPVGGLWTMLIGSFVMVAARAEYTATVTERFLGGIPVREVMSSPVETGSTQSSVEAFVHGHVLHGRHSAYPVLGPGGSVEGLVTLQQLRAVPSDRWTSTHVGEVALPLSQIAVCAPADPLTGVLQRTTRESGGRALVLEEGHLVGILTPADITRVLEARALLSSHGRRGDAFPR